MTAATTPLERELEILRELEAVARKYKEIMSVAAVLADLDKFRRERWRQGDPVPHARNELTSSLTSAFQVTYSVGICARDNSPFVAVVRIVDRLDDYLRALGVVKASSDGGRP